jgi:hypothetical protein
VRRSPASKFLKERLFLLHELERKIRTSAALGLIIVTVRSVCSVQHILGMAWTEEKERNYFNRRPAGRRINPEFYERRVVHVEEEPKKW